MKLITSMYFFILFYFDVEYVYGFVGWGSASKVDDVTALPSHIQDGGYALLWQRYDNNKMAAICFLHLQQYSRRLNFFLFENHSVKQIIAR